MSTFVRPSKAFVEGGTCLENLTINAGLPNPYFSYLKLPIIFVTKTRCPVTLGSLTIDEDVCFRVDGACTRVTEWEMSSKKSVSIPSLITVVANFFHVRK